MEFPPCPATLKSIQPYLKIACEHDGRDIVVAYWSRLFALQVGLKSSTHQPDETKLLSAIMDWLETTKRENSDNEAITNEIAAQAHMENYALKLFLYGDSQDRKANFGKNVVKAFYSSGIIYDVIQTFGELTEEAAHNRKYAKWKAAYIHNCLKNGETPISGPLPTDDDNHEVNNEAADEGVERNETDEQQPLPESTNATPPSTTPPTTTPPTVDEVLNNPNKLPSPPVEDEKPGGFEPFTADQPNPIDPPAVQTANVNLTPDDMIKAQKYCKYAGSALNYDDVNTAIDNLKKALTLLTTGQDV